ncbi:MAG TPA: DUF5677 domain-containing protein [Longimicrobium sp.]|jgi:hypothetical protein|uniref:DUF5677 domain-containing protein n=1 Tax=Longimicrobium sp. TaxID=2029185 RepID=UPI002ED969BE
MAKTSPWDLDFGESRKAAQKQLGHKLEVLRPLVQFSHKFLHDCRDVSVSEVDMVVAMAFRQCLEFADAVDILLRHMAIAPAAAQARGALEHAPQVVLLATRRDPVLAAAYLLSSLRQMEHELERKKKAGGLDEEDRAGFEDALDGLQQLYSANASDRAGKEALAALQPLGPGRPWYALRNGPDNIHKLIRDVGLDPLSHLYQDLNPVAHGGMPLMAIAAASGDPGSENDPDWLRPLRSTSPWSFRPILAAGTAVNVAFVHVFAYFVPRLQHWIAEFREFRKEHNRRCARAEMPVLGHPEDDPLTQHQPARTPTL